MDTLPAIVAEHHIRIAIMSVPAEAAQTVADKLVAVGIRGILNFASVSISVPHEVSVQGVDLAVQLEQLAFKMSLLGAEDATTPAPPTGAPGPVPTAPPSPPPHP
jgi:redox-sensing transcriptional repressor